MMVRNRCDRRAGFTLIEVLVALAITSIILATTAALTRSVALHFDHGAQGVSNAERVMHGVDRLASDFGATRFILQMTPAGVATAFIGTSRKVVFVTSSRMNGFLPSNETTSGADQVITLTIENDGSFSRLIRRSAEWQGPRAKLEANVPQDAVLLIEGQFDATFAFAKVAPNGHMNWSNQWFSERTLPRLVHLILRDRRRGVDLLAGNEFVLRSDGSPACALPNAKDACLNGGAARQARADSSPNENPSP
jgi:prepilin-type N-terminal cleavage/methylation domain-containing protein